MLSQGDKLLYARHLLLPEIGPAGQARLLGASVALPAQGEPRAASVAAAYLTRAGVQLRDGTAGAGSQLPLPDRAAVSALAGDAGLHEAAAALAGAFAAVEAIKLVVGAGHAAALPPDLTLAPEPHA